MLFKSVLFSLVFLSGFSLSCETKFWFNQLANYQTLAPLHGVGFSKQSFKVDRNSLVELDYLQCSELPIISVSIRNKALKSEAVWSLFRPVVDSIVTADDRFSSLKQITTSLSANDVQALFETDQFVYEFEHDGEFWLMQFTLGKRATELKLMPMPALIGEALLDQYAKQDTLPQYEESDLGSDWAFDELNEEYFSSELPEYFYELTEEKKEDFLLLHKLSHSQWQTAFNWSEYPYSVANQHVLYNSQSFFVDIAINGYQASLQYDIAEYLKDRLDDEISIEAICSVSDCTLYLTVETPHHEERFDSNRIKPCQYLSKYASQCQSNGSYSRFSETSLTQHIAVNLVLEEKYQTKEGDIAPMGYDLSRFKNVSQLSNQDFFYQWITEQLENADLTWSDEPELEPALEKPELAAIECAQYACRVIVLNSGAYAGNESEGYSGVGFFSLDEYCKPIDFPYQERRWENQVAKVYNGKEYFADNAAFECIKGI